jgi:hydroxymethylpyrimidine kinase/phosphomethylpyrimidine kinase/thiamine-phosphate diphosphorylase
MKPIPIVWSIAGSDAGGGAGIQADLNTFKDFDAHGCTVITALTAQNTQGVFHIQPSSIDSIQAQMRALKQDLPPLAIKIGMLYSADLIQTIALNLCDMAMPIIADPVLIATSGDALYEQTLIASFKQFIIPIASLLTPNVYEASILTGIAIKSFEDMEKAASILMSQGARAVLIKGGDLQSNALSSDYFCDHTQAWWINQHRIDTPHTHGTGCTLSSAIAAAVAQGWSLSDAIVLAKAYVHAGIGKPTRVGSGRHPIGHLNLKSLNKHFPWISNKPQPLARPFKQLTKPLGRYPVVDNIRDLEILCTKGITVIQLRIKNLEEVSEALFAKALEITESFGITLVVNDYIDIAKSIHAPALHLGQEDITSAPIETLNRETMILGITAHTLVELAKGYAHHPSYLTMGPVFETKSKVLDYPLIGLEKLAYIASLSPLPLVAIGGIALDQTQEILNLTCSGVAFINAAKQLICEGRYDRHLSLPGFSPLKQSRLLRANIVCVGTGGLASGFLPYLAAAGIGSITLIDGDKVSYSNLQRQILFRERDIGQPKVYAAAQYLSEINSNTRVIPINEYIEHHQAAELLRGYDLIIDGTDNFETHYLMNDLSRRLNIPLVAAAVFQNKGQLFYLSPHSGCYRCAFPSPAQRPSCQLAGILGTTPALLGVMQAALAIDLLLGIEYSSFCRTVDMKTGQAKTYNIAQSEDCDCASLKLKMI